MQGQGGGQDPRRPERIVRYTSPKSLFASQSEEKKDGVNEDLTPDYMNVLGMIFSMCALMLRYTNQCSSCLFVSVMSGSQGIFFPQNLTLGKLLTIILFFFYYLESSGVGGWLSTARVSVSPTPSTMTTPSRSCPASCCPSQQW